MANKKTRVGTECDGLTDKKVEKINCICNVASSSDPYYARWLLVEYAGKDSKLTSISDYILMSIEFQDKDSSLSEMFDRIADDELRHFKVLGKIIKKLGGKPRVNLNAIKDIRLNELKENLILKNSPDNIIEILKGLYEKERRSANNYKRLIDLCNDKVIKKTLNEILSDELKHMRELKSEMVKYKVSV